ncbi:hypothetical protein [Oleiagrimonas soli]|nr:hypothetical protein [Oleiagrimonas soli]MBB6185381.1 hypothetical protein [Oleiagrimonas soli]
MTPKARRVFAGAAGIVSALVTVVVIEFVGHSLYPPPGNLDLSDHDAVAAFIRTLPPGAFGFALSAWAFGVFDGTLVATVIARGKSGFYALLVGGVVLLAALANLAVIPHPMWFQVAALVLIGMAALAARLVGQLLMPTQP